jgi:flagellar basal-body rod modification protein FlgD
MTISEISYSTVTSAGTSASSAASSSTTSASSSSTSNPLASLSSDFTTFLQLLTTQLQNQDPLSPEDPDQFTQELVEMSGVEQQITGNSDLSQLVTLSQSNASATYMGFIGQTVTATSSQIALENGSAQFSYTLPSAASNVTISIKDSDGNTVATLTPSSDEAGTYDMNWDGTSDSGTTEPSGAYTISVSATDANGNAISGTSTQIIGTVTGVQTSSSGSAMLDIGSVSVAASSVTDVGSDSSTTSTTSTSSTVSTLASELASDLTSDL